MTAQVINIKPQSFNALVTQAKAAWDRADEKRADADDWMVRTGRILVELRAKAKEERVRWGTVVKKLGRSMRRTQELMQLAEGGATVEEQRERKRTSTARSKKRATGAHSDYRDDGKGELAYEGEDYEEWFGQSATPEEKVGYSMQNLACDILARRHYFDKHFKGWQKFKCPPQIKKVVGEAAAEFADLAATVARMGDRK